jgi:predicted ferric reductase
MWLTSLSWCRRHKFEWFWFPHAPLAITGYVFAYLHMPTLVNWLIPVFVLHGIDLLCRARNIYLRTCDIISITPLAGDITRLEVRRHNDATPMVYNGGQYCFIRIPLLSQVETHPFSISSGPPTMKGNNTSFTFHIKSMGAGTWTGRLFELAKQQHAANPRLAVPPPTNTGANITNVTSVPMVDIGNDSKGPNEIRIIDDRRTNTNTNNTNNNNDQVSSSLLNTKLSISFVVDGPYGHPAIPLEMYQTRILIAGGIGVTPCMSLLQQWMNELDDSPRLHHRIVFAWSMPDTNPLTWYQTYLLLYHRILN